MTVISSAAGSGPPNKWPLGAGRDLQFRRSRCSNDELRANEAAPNGEASTPENHSMDFELPKLAPTSAFGLNATSTTCRLESNGNDNLSASHNLETAQTCHETVQRQNERLEQAGTFHKLKLGKFMTISRWNLTCLSLVITLSFIMQLFAITLAFKTSSGSWRNQRALAEWKRWESSPSSKPDKIFLLHSRLQQLKRELDEELANSQALEQVVAADSSPSGSGGNQTGNKTKHVSSVQQPVSLGSPCLSSSFCSKSIKNSQCNLDTFTCQCLSQHVKFNSTTCLAPSLLGYECQLDEQCRQRVPESVCQLGKCSCQSDKFVSYKKNKCLTASKLNDYCLLDSQCQLNDKHSQCRWKIQNVYGTCKCPPNYKLITDQGNNLRCAPRLGDTCLSDDECQLATANSICATDTEQHDQKMKWATSSASNKRCTCANGFESSRSKLDCLSEAAHTSTEKLAPELHSTGSTTEIAPNGSSLPSAQTTLLMSKQQQDSHKYELVQVEMTARDKNASSERVELEIKLMPMDTTTTTTTTTVGPAPNTTIQGQQFRMSSLGKPCKWRQECQMRDPNSDCIDGVCECLAPSSRCRASRTGCHRDTFQCRSGQCISWYFVCDQFRNCDDGSDEDECERAFHCPRESFQCQQDGQCLTKGKVCDGKRDCGDGSDELHCKRRPVAADSVLLDSVGANNGGCPADAFACSSGQCLPGYVFCNAVEDCQDGSDEDELICEQSQRSTSLAGASFNALTTTTRGHVATPGGISTLAAAPSGAAANATLKTPPEDKPAAESQLVKTDRASIERLMSSLALRQRGPSTAFRPLPSHHQERLKTTTTTGRMSRLMPGAGGKRPTTSKQHQLVKQGQREQQQRRPDECPRHAFTCRNGKCRSSAILCSGVDGCGDNSDEDQCEVCQCEAPSPNNQLDSRQQAQLTARAANSRRRNGWITPPA